METPKKNSLYLRKRSPKKASYIPGNGTFQPKPEKNLKSSLRKKFLIFQKMELSNSKIKKFLIISQKKAFLIFSQKKPPTLSGLGPQKLSKISYIFSNKPLIFWETEIPKKNPIFQETEFSYTSAKEYSETQHTWNQKHIQNPNIFGTMTYLEHCQASMMERFAKLATQRTLKSFFIFGKWNFLALALRNFLYFLKRNLFLHLRKRNFIIFQERNIQNPSTTELCLYFRKEIFRTLA